MELYYVGKGADGRGQRLLHAGNCPDLPSAKELILLGEHSSSVAAMEEARKLFPVVAGCAGCCSECELLLIGQIAGAQG